MLIKFLPRILSFALKLLLKRKKNKLIFIADKGFNKIQNSNESKRKIAKELFEKLKI